MKPHIGTDESGKGDYFGPLVVAAAHVDDALEAHLRALGVRDCKRLSDGRVIELAKGIRESCKWQVVRINPEKYNALHAKFGNLNELLAWAHARAIENLLAKVDCDLVISDQFGDEAYLRKRLMKKGARVELVQMPRAESDMAVAAASVLARAEFLASLDWMTKAWGLPFPKGASNVEHQGRMFVAAYGFERLGEVAKVHFKTTEKLRLGPDKAE